MWMRTRSQTDGSRRLVTLSVWLILVAGCGGGGTSTATPEGSACDAYVEEFVESTQAVLNSIGNVSADEMNASTEVQGAMGEWDDIVFGTDIDSVCDGREEFEALLCDRMAELEAFGPEGQAFLENNTPPCDL